MNRDEALEIARTMHSQKIPYERIAEHLAAQGYISEKTKKPLGHLAVRHMVTMAEKKDRDETPKLAKEDKMLVTGADEEMMQAVRRILEITDIPIGIRKKLANYVLK